MQLSYCGNTVRTHDPDRFLLSLFYDADVRDGLHALYAFNYEIAKTREVVTETQLGLIRLQWWRDAISGIYERDHVLKHQVVEPLATAIQKHDLPRDLFDHLIYAREFDLEDRAPSNMDGFFHYADYTCTPLVKLTAMVTGEDISDDDAKLWGEIYAGTGLLRALPIHLPQRRCYLPEDLIHKAEMTIYDLYDGTGVDKLPQVIAPLMTALREKWRTFPPQFESKQARFIRSLTGMYLTQLERAGGQPFDTRVQNPPAFKVLRLWWAV